MITYRKAEERDKKDFGELEREFNKDYDGMNINGYLKRIPSQNIPEKVFVDLFEECLSSDKFFIVADNGGKTVGYILAEIKPNEYKDYYEVKSYGCIDTVFVDKEFRGQGIGTELIDRANEWLKSKGINVCTLEAGKENIGAVRLYEKLGFQISNIEMWKQI